MSVISNVAILNSVVEAFGCSQGGLLLDVGAGKSPYRGLIEEAGWRYESADWPNSIHQNDRHTYDCAADEIPVEDERFDAILCTEVLEHVPNPASTLVEFNRISSWKAESC